MSWQPEGYQPEGWQPEGWQPGEVAYPTVDSIRSVRLPGSRIFIIDPGEQEYYEVIWEDILPNGVTLASVVWTIPPPFTNGGAAIDLINGKSAVLISDASVLARHGQLYLVEVEATLSNASVIEKAIPLRCFNT